jgi:hypothetical protein
VCADEAFMIQIENLGKIMSICKDSIDKNRNKLPICLIGDHGQTMPMHGGSIIQPRKFENDDYLIGERNKIMSNLNTFISFTKIERVLSKNPKDLIPQQFKEFQMDIRKGDIKNGEHYTWLTNNAVFFPADSKSYVDNLIETNKIDEFKILVPTQSMMREINVGILYTKKK